MSPGQILSILWRRSWIILLTFMSTMAGAGAVMFFVPARYDAIATATMDPGQTDPVTGQASHSGLLRITQGNLIALLKSQRVAAEVVKSLNLASNRALSSQYLESSARGRVDIVEWIAAEMLIKNIDAQFAEGSNVLTLKFKSSSPTQAALVANTLMTAFIDTALELKVSTAQQTARWFEPQMAKLQTDLAAARERLTKFQREANFLAPTALMDNDNSELASTTTDLATARTQLLTLQSQLNSNINVGNSEAFSARVRLLRNQVQALERARAEQMQRMIALQTQREHFASLKREVDFRQEQLDNAAKTAAAAQMQSRLSFSNITPLDVATPPVAQAFPKWPLVLTAGIGSGMALGVIFALLAEALDRRIRGVTDLRFAASVPVLGVLRKERARRPRPRAFAFTKRPALPDRSRPLNATGG